ncbi:MAG: tetratricopeptide repeat protein [Alphaproteobacteria bacterium]|nr:tetratricopeptide repeat protein [Alphaproteobacteria bacterium]
MPNSADESAISTELAVLRQRIDDIVAGQQRSTAWYRNPSFITSCAAIFISVTTTVVSWYRTYQQEIASLRGQLASTLHQTAGIHLQNVELMAKYRNDQPSMLRLSTTLNAQNLLLAKQAYSLARELGSAASAASLTTVANSLMQSNEVTLAEDLLQKAIARAENSVEYIAALRVLGALQYYNGNLKVAADTFDKAVKAFTTYPNEAKSADYVNFTHAFTYMHWTQSARQSDCPTAKAKIELAEQHWQKLTEPAKTQMAPMGAELFQMKEFLKGCS